ncbi:hypothetical protein [Flavobacterium sp. '19STA2R22 D10 B1']|uniref:hypothetical protein n=1 Tax=Flavobacterium aerium TaxID=3037261 RepID=UPI00278C4C6D|nr:hypothetical protein [Flavobacterium sp. '19STA2R22 D10 B1']
MNTAKIAHLVLQQFKGLPSGAKIQLAETVTSITNDNRFSAEKVRNYLFDQELINLHSNGNVSISEKGQTLIQK